MGYTAVPYVFLQRLISGIKAQKIAAARCPIIQGSIKTGILLQVTHKCRFKGYGRFKLGSISTVYVHCVIKLSGTSLIETRNSGLHIPPWYTPNWQALHQCIIITTKLILFILNIFCKVTWTKNGYNRFFTANQISEELKFILYPYIWTFGQCIYGALVLD